MRNPTNPREFRRRPVLWTLLWLALIFITSSGVVRFDDFVRFVQGLGGGYAFNEWFARFWLASWFIAVKGWHVTEYAVLVALCSVGLQSLFRWNLRKCVGAAFAFSVLFAASDEWHQTFVPDRDGCVRDVVIDSVGGALAAGFLLSRHTRKHRGRDAEPTIGDAMVAAEPADEM